MKKHLMFTLLLLLSLGLVAGQTWIRYYLFNDLCPGPNNSASSKACNVIPAIGGGYLLQGYVEFANEDVLTYANNVFWKLDENGDIVWRRTGGGNFVFNSVVSNGIDRYYCLSTQSGYSTLCIFDNELNWLGYYHKYNASLYDMQYVDDGLIFAGKVNGQAVVLKTDFQFNVVWQSDGFSLYGFGFNTIEPYDNGWISLARGKFANFTAVGDTIWTYTAVDYSTSLFDCKVSSDNNIYILGYYKLWRVNSEGQSLELVADSIPAGYPLNEIVSLEVLPNGNLVYLSRSSTNQILHCYNPDGTLQWSRSYNTFGAIYFGKGSKNLLVMPDGSILFPMHHGTIVLVKTDSEGNVVANDDPIAPVFVSSIMAYPQPASSTVMISVKSDLVGDLGYSIFNIRGQRIYSGKINGHHKDQSFELPNEVLDIIPNGIYLISLDLGNSKIATTKLVVVK
ncbi:MAG TPA: T9SS type A sorting domain-containing protein [Candidatus Syntrophosphaera thermopropionivorans]|jgi:hypothetical protein|nr:T9SS type A sorting domain-containing protein [Candidatus Syntrophosphaera thermopropionivorans]